MMGIFGPYSPFLVGGSGLSFRGGGSKLHQGGGSLRNPSEGGRPPCPPPCPRMIFSIHKSCVMFDTDSVFPGSIEVAYLIN